jgi:hypothetical protein
MMVKWHQRVGDCMYDKIGSLLRVFGLEPYQLELCHLDYRN